MRLTYLTLLFAAIGTVATFLPWVHYPKGNANLYGYAGDGLITGFLFFVVTILSLFEIIKKKDFSAIKIASGIIGLLMLILAVNNIFEIEHQKTNFETDNPFIGAAFAGFTQGTGLYVLGIAGLGVFLFNLFGFLGHRANQESTQNKKLSIYIPLGIIVLVAGIFIGNRLLTGSAPSADRMSAIFKKDVEAMGQCLITEDYDCFIRYNHPMIVQSYGSKEKMKDLLSQMMRGYKEYQGQYKKIAFVDVGQIESAGRNIQAVINQEVTLDKHGEQVTEHQKVLAVSEDNGTTWHYINLTGTDKEKISRFYPELNKKLNF